MKKPPLYAIGTLFYLFSFPAAAYESQPGQYCREYTETVKIGNRTETAYGTACMQPDGSWQKVGEPQLPPHMETTAQYPYQPPQVIIQEKRVYTPTLWPLFRVTLGDRHWHGHKRDYHHKYHGKRHFHGHKHKNHPKHAGRKHSKRHYASNW